MVVILKSCLGMLKENWNIENLKLNVENLFCLVCKLKWKIERERVLIGSLVVECGEFWILKKCKKWRRED